METKGIIFDFGGVFSNGGSFRPFLESYAKIYGKGYEEFRQVFNRNWHKASINEIPSREFWANTAEFLEIPAAELRRDCTTYFTFNFETLELARKLKANYKLALLSNNIEDWLEENLDDFRMRDLFDCIVTSYGSGTKKPDKRIYTEALERLALQAQECIFIDDLERNLPPARELGITTIQFKSTEQIYKELQLLGIKI